MDSSKDNKHSIKQNIKVLILIDFPPFLTSRHNDLKSQHKSYSLSQNGYKSAELKEEENGGYLRNFILNIFSR